MNWIRPCLSSGAEWIVFVWLAALPFQWGGVDSAQVASYSQEFTSPVVIQFLNLERVSCRTFRDITAGLKFFWRAVCGPDGEGTPEKIIELNEDDIFDFGYSPGDQQLAVTRGDWQVDIVLIRDGLTDTRVAAQ